MENNRLTGYPSIDKPWMKYYSNDKICMELPKCNMYEYILRNNRGHSNDIAIDFMGKTLTYGDLFNLIDAIACGLASLGIGQRDVVSFVSITTPEIIGTIYAVNKLGAICNMIDPRATSETILSILRNTKTKVLIVLDNLAGVIPDHINEDCKIVVLRTGTANGTISFPFIDWCKILSDTPNKLMRNFESDMPALIEYTGGTTGEPKGVVLSNENVNSAAFQYSRTRIPNNRGEIWQTVSAPFIAYAFIFSMHIPLSLGMVCKIVIYDPKTIALLTVEEKFNHIAGNPLMWENVIHLPEAQKRDFSHIIAPITGADYMSVSLEIEINEFLKQHGCKWTMCQGYGLTETAAGICINQGEGCYKIGSVGIPFIDTIISVFDTDSSCESTYNQQGEICISGPSVMLGYFNNKEATDDMIKVHKDGTRWLHTGDLGHIDTDGFIYIDGRIKRMFVYYNGAKIFPPIIERIIMQHEIVSGCVVVGKQDMNHAVGKVPVAFVVLNSKEPNNTILDELEMLCKNNLPEYERPVEWHVINEFPRTKIGKVDYRTLEQQAAETK